MYMWLDTCYTDSSGGLLGVHILSSSRVSGYINYTDQHLVLMRPLNPGKHLHINTHIIASCDIVANLFLASLIHCMLLLIVWNIFNSIFHLTMETLWGELEWSLHLKALN